MPGRADMHQVARRLGRLEEIYHPWHDAPEVSRWVVSILRGPANLATSTCIRRLQNGKLTEIVHLDGSSENLTSEAIEQFVRSFPIEEVAEC
jgi:hypothetical protein